MRQNRPKARKYGIRAIALSLCAALLLVFAGCGEQSGSVSTVGSVVGSDVNTVTETYFDENFYFHVTDDANIVSENGLYFANNELLVVPNASVTRADVEAALSADNGSIVGYSDLTNEYQIQFAQEYGLAELQALQEKLGQSGLYSSVRLNYGMDLTCDYYPTSDTQWAQDWSQTPQGDNWGVEAIQAPAAWDSRDTLETVNVGLIDNWFYTDHTDLNFERTYYNRNWDDSAHGTHTSGTIAAGFDNGVGISGIMPNVNLYGFAINGTAAMTTEYICSAALRILIERDQCKVINISMGLQLYNFAASHGNVNAQAVIDEINAGIERLLLALVNNGHEFVIVKSAGNDNARSDPSEDHRYTQDPTAFIGYVQDKNGSEYGDTDAVYDFFSGITNPEVQSRILVVGAAELTESGAIQMAPYSNHGDRVDLAAPGSSIESTYANLQNDGSYQEGYALGSGTSMAAPHVAGVAAMLFGASPTLTGAQVKEILCSTATGSYGYADSAFTDTYPLLNAQAAMETVLSGGYVGTGLEDFTLPSEQVIAIGETNVIEPTVQPEDAVEYQMTWTSSDESVATIASGGIVYGVSKGVAEISATAMCNGQQVTRTTQLRVASQARDTILVLDVSGSMSGTPLEEMKEAAIQFCTDLLEDPYSNRVGLVYYDSYVENLNLTSDLNSLISVINNLSAGSRTNMYGGLERAQTMMEQFGKEDAIKNIVIMADGLPNEGQTSSSGAFSSSNFSWYGYAYENAVVDIGNEIMQEYNLYSLGFFHQLSGTSEADAVALMEMLTNQVDGYHEVVEAENLQFAFGEIAEDIDNGARIVINIACPVDVEIRYNGEILSSAASNYKDTASFGALKLLGKKKDIKVVTLDADKVYDVTLNGTDDGAMDYTINYFDDSDSITDSRGFRSVPITSTTKITSSTDNTAAISLNIDADGDGSVDSVWSAGKNKIGSEVREPSTEVPTGIGEMEATNDTSSVSGGMVALICLVVLLVVGIVVGVAIAAGNSGRGKKAQTVPIIPVQTDVPPISPPEADATAETTSFAALEPGITILSGSLTGKRFTLREREVTYIGKTKQAQIRLPNTYGKVSRLHCSIEYNKDMGRYFVTDCSSNGTYFKNHNRFVRGKRTSVTPGTVLLLADEDCTIELEKI